MHAISTLQRLLTHPVSRNAAALYAVKFGGFVLPLITLPYLARVLGPSGWGLVVFTQSYALWLSMIVEYGFVLSATRDVARSYGDSNTIAETAAGVLGAKGVLITAGTFITVLAFFVVPVARANPVYILCGWFYAIAQGLSPLWYFQGVERMAAPATMDLIARVLSTGAVFWLVREPGQGWVVIGLQALTTGLAALVSHIWMYREIPFRLPRITNAMTALRSGWSMFFFRAAVSLYTTANGFLLGLVGEPTAVAFYGTAERLAKAPVALIGPFSQALYPRMNQLLRINRPRAAKVARGSFLGMVVPGLLLAALLASFGRPLVVLMFGQDYIGAVPAFQVLVFVVPAIAAGNVLGIQWMLPLGMDRLFNSIIMMAGLINIVTALALSHVYGSVGMAVAVLTSELFVSVSLFVVLTSRNNNPLLNDRCEDGQ